MYLARTSFNDMVWVFPAWSLKVTEEWAEATEVMTENRKGGGRRKRRSHELGGKKGGKPK
jgi:hypothetical protein